MGKFLRWLLGETIKDAGEDPDSIRVLEIIRADELVKSTAPDGLIELVISHETLARLHALCNSNEHLRGRIPILVVDVGTGEDRMAWKRYMLRNVALMLEGSTPVKYDIKSYTVAVVAASSLEETSIPISLNDKLEMWP